MNDFITIVGSKQKNAARCSIDSVSPTLTEAMGMGGGQIPLLTNATIEETKTYNFMEQERKHQIELPEELKGKKFRIRKLTPRECFRLMGVNDSDIDKMQAAGISNSGLYKLAGNSIVAGGNHTDSNGNVDGVLYNLFRKMFIETGVEKSEEPHQLTLL